MLCRHLRRLATTAQRTMSCAAGINARRLEGKVAVVTASTDGIGFAIARRLGQEGAKVVISSRKQANVDSALEELKKDNLDVTGLVCHVGKKEHREELISKAASTYGGIDILVSNAAANPHFGAITDITEDQWDKIFDTNVKASFFLAKDAMPHMEKRGGGSIIFVSSIGGYNPFEMIAPYSVSKTALLGLIKAMVPQFSSIGVRVNAIAPGVIKTKFSNALWNDPSVEETVAAQCPMNRLGRPEECAGAVAFLASSDASYITGETIVMSGGMPSRL